MSEIEETIEGKTIRSENFSKKNLEKHSFTGCVFHNCDLGSTDFSSSTQYDIDPRTNKITKAKFSFPEAAGLLRAFDITLI